MTKEISGDELKRPVITVVGLVVAIVGLLLSAIPIINNFAFLLALVSLVLGIVGLVKSRKVKGAGRTMGIIVVVLSVMALGVVILSQSFYSDAIDDAANEFNNSVDRSTGNKTEEILGKDVDVQIGTLEAPADEYGYVTTKLPVKVTNKLGEKKTYAIKIEAVDASGNRIVDDTVYANELNANQTQDFSAFQYIESSKVEAVKTATFKIVSVSQY